MTDAATDLVLAARTDAGPDRFAFATADGVCSSDALRTPELLLADALWDRPPAALLVPEANYGVVGTLLACVAESVTMTESSARAAALCRKNVRRNDVDASVSLVAELTELDATREKLSGDAPPFDTVAYVPKPYIPLTVGRQRIADALALLAPGGRCLVAAEPTTGLARYHETLETLCDEAEIVVERDGVSVVEAIQSSPDTDSGGAERPNYGNRPRFVEPRILEPTVDGVGLELVSVPGLFAAGELDRGTRLLIEWLEVRDGARVLDACCGYGPIGTYAAASADCSVWLTDDDRIATRCAACSLERTGVDATVVTGDCTDAVSDRTFDLVATNPPTHAGSGVLSGLFAGVHEVLDRDGECLFVRHEALDLSAHLRCFREIETVATGAEHVVRRALP